MDNPSGAANNEAMAQLSNMSAPIVSTLTTATPITSEIVSDFEPDSKFEITTLEMASYDCQDLYPTTDLLESQDVEPHSSTDASVSETRDVAQHQTEDPKQSEQATLVEPQKLDEDDKPQVSHEQLTSAEKNLKDLESVTLIEPPQQIRQENASTKLDSKLDQPNDCKTNEPEKIVGESDGPSSFGPQAQAGEIVTNSKTIMQSTKVDFSNGYKSVSQEQDSVADTDMFTADNANKNNDSNVHPLSQTSVDAQMEKVIDNIVELGGVHQFPQSLVNPEGKEEFLATIHREITGERGSIDLIADVACRQRSIEIEPVATLDQRPGEESKEPVSINVPDKQISETNMEKMDTTENVTEIPQEVVTTIDDKPAKTDLDSTQLVEEQVDQGEFSGQDVIEELVTEEKVIEEKSTQEEFVESKVFEDVMNESIVEGKNSPPSLQIHETNMEEKVPASTEVLKNPEQVEESKAPKRSPRRREAVEDKKIDEVKTSARPSRQRGSVAREKVIRNEGLVQPLARSAAVSEVSNDGAKEEKAESAEIARDIADKGKAGEEKMDDDQVLTRSLRPRASLKRARADEISVEDPPKLELSKKQVKKSRGSNVEHTPIIKLPNFRSRTTISSSDPITRLDSNKYDKETKAPTNIVSKETDKKYICEQCGYATDRLNNLVYHSTKSFCRGKCQIGEVMKADIIRQQQQAKNKRRSIR